MKITEARLIVCSPDRNFVTLKLCTLAGRAQVGRHPDGLVAVEGGKDRYAYVFRHLSPRY